MEIFTNLADISSHYPHVVVALGTFDGVHIGHQRIIRHAAQAAAAVGGISAVFTFANHPLSVIDAARSPKQITTRERKAALISQMGVDLLFDIPFTPELLRLTPAQFAELLCRRLAPKQVVVGPNFTFGYQGAGDPDTLREQGRLCGFTVAVQDAVFLEGMRVSSTLIREKIAAGDVKTAGKLLGRPVELGGLVISGDRRGRTLGFPTANVAIGDAMAAPADGVYAARAAWNGEVHDAVVNVGDNPTFGKLSRRMEVHVLDFRGDLYNQTMNVFFVERLRGETAFAGPEQLIRQIGQDIALARSVLADSPEKIC